MSGEIVPILVSVQEAKFVARFSEDMKSSIKKRSPALPKQFSRRAKATISEIIESLVSAAADSKPKVRADAAWALGKAAECSKTHRGGQVVDEVMAAVSKLVELLADEVSDVHKIAVVALQVFCPQAASVVVPALIKNSLDDPVPQVAIAAQKTLRACGQGPASRAVDLLIRALRQDDLPLQQVTCETLGWLGVEARPAIAPLIEIVAGDGPESVQIGAAQALAHIDPRGEFVTLATDDSQKLDRIVKCLACPGEKESMLRESLGREMAHARLEAGSATRPAGTASTRGQSNPDGGGELKTVKPKRSTHKGEARAKLIAALTLHHRYEDGGCLNTEPIGVKALARQAKVSSGSASEFFTREFEGQLAYKTMCRNPDGLTKKLKRLNGEKSALWLDGREPREPPLGYRRAGRTPGGGDYGDEDE